MYMYVCISEVGGVRQPGNRFVSFVRAMRSCVCPRDDVGAVGWVLNQELSSRAARPGFVPTCVRRISL